MKLARCSYKCIECIGYFRPPNDIQDFCVLPSVLFNYYMPMFNFPARSAASWQNYVWVCLKLNMFN